MKKNIACPNCKGNGYITIMTGNRNDYCGVASKMCPACDGTGVQLADVTNADRIRAMSDEELAEWMAECNAYGENADASQWMPWLKQPAQEVDNG